MFATLPGTAGSARDRPDRPRRHDAGRARRRAWRRSSTRTTTAAPIVLPGDPSQVIDPAEEPELGGRVGHDIVTSDGTTLLGADDKAGVAEIMAAVALLAEPPEPRAPRCASRSRSTRRSGVARITSTSRRSGPRSRTRSTAPASASSRSRRSRRARCRVTIRGRGAHPGSAKGKLVNAVKLAADFVAALPQRHALARDDRGARGLRPSVARRRVGRGGGRHA